MKEPFVLVVVPFKGEVQLLGQLLFSLSVSYITGFAWSVILWDDGSTDDELNTLYNLIPNSILILKHNNVGYTQSVFNIVNYAKEQSEFDHLLILNSDTKFERGALFSLIKRSVSNPNCFAVGGKILKYNTDQILHTGTRLENGEIVDPYCELHRDDPRTNFVERRLWVNGCATLYKLDIMRKEDLNFDLHFLPAYFEEADLMTKTTAMGYVNLYEPRAVIHHVLNASHNHERQKYENIFWNNWDKYLTKWKPFFKEKYLQF